MARLTCLLAVVGSGHVRGLTDTLMACLPAWRLQHQEDLHRERQKVEGACKARSGRAPGIA